MPPEELFSTREAADYMGVTPASVRKMVDNGLLVPTNQLSSHNLTYLFKRKDVERHQRHRLSTNPKLQKEKK